MIAEAPPSIADQAETLIRDRVGAFMQARAKIERLKYAPNLDVRNRAVHLAVRQRELEARLDEKLKVIDQAKQGVWTVGGLLGLSAFARDMVTHTKEVDALTEGQPVAVAAAGGMPMWAMVGLAGVGVWWLYQQLSR